MRRARYFRGFAHGDTSIGVAILGRACARARAPRDSWRGRPVVWLVGSFVDGDTRARARERAYIVRSLLRTRERTSRLRGPGVALALCRSPPVPPLAASRKFLLAAWPGGVGGQRRGEKNSTGFSPSRTEGPPEGLLDATEGRGAHARRGRWRPSCASVNSGGRSSSSSTAASGRQCTTAPVSLRVPLFLSLARAHPVSAPPVAQRTTIVSSRRTGYHTASITHE